MKSWPRPGVIALVKELYELSAENRDFLHARLLPQRIGQTTDEVKRKLVRMLSVSAARNNQFRHADVKRLIDQFAKGSDDPAAVADLLVTDLEASFATFAQVGDWEQMVDHLYATIARLEKVLERLERQALVPLLPRLNALAEKWGAEFGYGISDEITAFAADWDERARG